MSLCDNGGGVGFETPGHNLNFFFSLSLSHSPHTRPDIGRAMAFAPRSLPCTEFHILIRVPGFGYRVLGFRDPNLHFVESPALAPPEVVINADQQRQ